MTKTLYPVIGANKPCNPWWSMTPKNICAGRVTGLDVTISSGQASITPGIAYVLVTTQEDGMDIQFPLQWISTQDESIPMGINKDLIIKIDPTIIGKPNNIYSSTEIGQFEVVNTGTGGAYHAVIATTDGSGNVTMNNAGLKILGCDYCMKCINGVLQLPSTKVNGSLESNSLETGAIQSSNIVSNGTVTANNFIGDGSGLINVSTDSIPYMTTSTSGLGEIATGAEADSNNTTRLIVPKQLTDHTNEFISSGRITTSGTTTINHNLGRAINSIRFIGNKDQRYEGIYTPGDGYCTWGFDQTTGSEQIFTNVIYKNRVGSSSATITVANLTNTTVQLVGVGNFQSDVDYIIHIS